jgi:hypothetical protein
MTVLYLLLRVAFARAKVLRLLLAFSPACVLQLAHGECAPIEITYPARGSTVKDTRPEVRWKEVTGAKSYRIQIESRVPEGRVIERVDALASGARFLPPRPLADERAAVKLLVTADCAGSPSVAPQPAWFYVDAAASCAPVQGLELSGSGAPTAAWSRGGRATRYEVEAYSYEDGRLLARGETTLVQADLPRAAVPLLVAVRPRCDSRFGQAAYGLLPASR